MVSLGQALFFGCGAYCAGTMNHYWGLSPFLTIPLAAVFGGLISTILLLPVLRLRGIYFSMVTLILPLMLGAALGVTLAVLIACIAMLILDQRRSSNQRAIDSGQA